MNRTENVSLVDVMAASRVSHPFSVLCWSILDTSTHSHLHADATRILLLKIISVAPPGHFALLQMDQEVICLWMQSLHSQSTSSRKRPIIPGHVSPRAPCQSFWWTLIFHSSLFDYCFAVQIYYCFTC